MTNKAVFLDRDDTILDDPGYISSPEQVKLLPGAAKAIASLSKLGFKTIVISNQSGVARGIVTEKGLNKIHDHFEKLLGDNGAYLDAIYYCPYHPQGTVKEYTKESNLRKPNNGMIIQAAKDFDIDLKASWMIGDSYRDVEAGVSSGCKTILISSSAKPKKPKSSDPTPNYIATNLLEAANIIKMQNSNPTEKKKVTTKPKKASTHLSSEVAQKEPITQKQPEPKVQAKSEAEQKQDTTHNHPSLEDMVAEILHNIKRKERESQFTDFSVFKLIAATTQLAVIITLIISVYVMLSANFTNNETLIPLAFAIVLQLITLTLLQMNSK